MSFSAFYTQLLSRTSTLNMKVVAFLFIISYLEFVSGQADWTYNNQGAWTGDCSTGKAQSPIEINPFTTDMDKKSYMPFSFYGYDQTPKESKLMTTKNFVKAVVRNLLGFLIGREFPTYSFLQV